MTTVEIFAIGNELLRGIVAESNSHWLAKRIAARGADLRRVTILPDDVEIVASELRAALERAPDLLVTHGGIGPTDDDRTREMIARALGVPRTEHPEALAIVRRRYAELAAAGAVADAALDEARRRMADLPAGARAFDNQIGGAPTFAVRAGATTVVALPGVPPELFWIWEHSLAPLLDDVLGPGGFAEQTIGLATRDESALAGLLERVQAAHPHVYVKSRAHGFERGDDVRVTLAASGVDDADASARVAAARADLLDALRAAGVALRAEAAGG